MQDAAPANFLAFFAWAPVDPIIRLMRFYCIFPTRIAIALELFSFGHHALTHSHTHTRALTKNSQLIHTQIALRSDLLSPAIRNADELNVVSLFFN